MTTQGLASYFAIELATQEIVPIANLPDHAPRRRQGKKLNVATAYRWCNGVRARDGSTVCLPTIQVGGTRCTSIEAFQWFCERLGARSSDPGPSTTSARRKAAERAERDLDAIGI
jgi:hypothetical protein